MLACDENGFLKLKNKNVTKSALFFYCVKVFEEEDCKNGVKKENMTGKMEQI